MIENCLRKSEISAQFIKEPTSDIEKNHFPKIMVEELNNINMCKSGIKKYMLEPRGFDYIHELFNTIHDNTRV